MTDVITAIKNDHREVEGLLAEAKAADAAGKEELVKRATKALAQHSAAEEILVYPAVRRAAGHTETEQAIDEHQEIKRVLADLEKLDATDERYDVKLSELEATLEHHVREEEDEILPALAAKVDQSRLDSMGQVFEQMKPLLPTHPHPAVPGTAVAQLMAGPLASVADRMRDLLGR